MQPTTLRNYQQQLWDNLRCAAKRHKRILAVLPTGGGKTRVFCDIAAHARSNGRSVQVLVHRRELVHQTPDPSVTTIQSWQPSDHDLVIVDEAHHAMAKTWKQKLALCPYLLGFTATPQRTDGRGLDDIFDAMVLGPNTETLINGGWLSQYRCFSLPDQPDWSRLTRSTGGDYNTNQLEDLMVDPLCISAAIKNWKHYAAGRQTIAFCVSIPHMKAVAAAFTAAGIHTDTIDGRMARRQRDDIIQRFRDGTTTVLLSVDLISEGFDVPACSCVLLLRRTKSLVLHLQQCGRALRPSDTYAIILDGAGNSLIHGLPDTPRLWSLKGKANRDAGRLPIRECPECYAVHAIHLKVCPFCGYEHEPKPRPIKAGATGVMLQELTHQQLKARRQEVAYAMALPLPIARVELARIAKARGYKMGWVHYRLEEIRATRNNSPEPNQNRHQSTPPTHHALA